MFKLSDQRKQYILEKAVIAIELAHGEFCVPEDECTCSDIASDLRKLQKELS